MTKNLEESVVRKYGYILDKLNELLNNNILPRELKPMIKNWNDHLSNDSLKSSERTEIEKWLKEGLRMEEEEKRRDKDYVW